MADKISLPVVDMQGKEVSRIEIDPAEFGGTVNRQLLHDVVVMQQANQRQGTVRTKKRDEIAGTGKKMYKQKGTGHARAGDKRTHKRRGGGTAHGPKPRDFSYTMPKKARRAATRMALLSKFQDNEAVVVSDLKLETVKTKSIATVLKAVGVNSQSCLIATDGLDRTVYLSARNLPKVDIAPAREMSTLNLLLRKRLVITLSALESLRHSGDDDAANDGSEA